MRSNYTIEQVEKGLGFDELYDADLNKVKPHIFFCNIFTKLELKERMRVGN